MRLCKRANVKNKTKKERGREEGEEEETERKVESRNLVHSISGGTRATSQFPRTG